MSEFAEGNVTKRFFGELPDVAGALERRLPSLDRTLDEYLDRNFEAIIEEWQLLREDDLIELERRMDRVSGEITRLAAGKADLIARAEKLDTLIGAIERRKRR